MLIWLHLQWVRFLRFMVSAMAAVVVRCVDPGLVASNLRTTTGDAHVVLALNERELDVLVAQLRDAKVEMRRWRRDNPVPGTAWYPQ